MPGTYTIWTDPSVPPVQHARQEVPIEYRNQIKKALDDMVLKGVMLLSPWQPPGCLCYFNSTSLMVPCVHA